MFSLTTDSLLYVVALCTAGSKMVTQMMVQNHLIAHYRKLETVKRELNCLLICDGFKIFLTDCAEMCKILILVD